MRGGEHDSWKLLAFRPEILYSYHSARRQTRRINAYRLQGFRPPITLHRLTANSLMPLLEVSHIHKSYSTTRVLHDLARAETPTVPYAVVRYLSRPGALNYGQAMAMSTLLMLVVSIGLIGIERFRFGGVGEF